MGLGDTPAEAGLTATGLFGWLIAAKSGACTDGYKSWPRRLVYVLAGLGLLLSESGDLWRAKSSAAWPLMLDRVPGTRRLEAHLRALLFSRRNDCMQQFERCFGSTEYVVSGFGPTSRGRSAFHVLCLGPHSLVRWAHSQIPLSYATFDQHPRRRIRQMSNALGGHALASRRGIDTRTHGPVRRPETSLIRSC